MTRRNSLHLIIISIFFSLIKNVIAIKEDNEPLSDNKNNSNEDTEDTTNDNINWYEECRMYPMWNAYVDLYDKCSKVMKYDETQQERTFWNKQLVLDYEGIDQTSNINTCLLNAMEEFYEELTDEDYYKYDVNEPYFDGMYVDGEVMLPVLIQIVDAISEYEAYAVVSLSHCVQDILDDERFLIRDFGGGGGNDTTFLASLLQKFLPGVAAQVYNLATLAYEKAQWNTFDADTIHSSKQSVIQIVNDKKNKDEKITGDKEDDDSVIVVKTPYLSKDDDKDFNDSSTSNNNSNNNGNNNRVYPLPKDLGIRTSEHLNYTKHFAAEGLSSHMDTGSTYTVLISLCNPSDYDGGYYYLHRDFQHVNNVYMKPKRLSAIVFLSDLAHAVTPLSNHDQDAGKHREMFTTELWTLGNLPINAMPRPHRCDMEAYIDILQNQSNRPSPSYYLPQTWPNQDDIDKYLQNVNKTDCYYEHPTFNFDHDENNQGGVAHVDQHYKDMYESTKRYNNNNDNMQKKEEKDL